MSEADRQNRIVLAGLASIAALAVCWGVAGYRAESRANSLCSSIHVGDDASRALALMKASGGHLGFDKTKPFVFPKHDPSFLVVWFEVFPTDKSECAVYQSGSKITKLETFHEN